MVQVMGMNPAAYIPLLLWDIYGPYIYWWYSVDMHEMLSLALALWSQEPEGTCVRRKVSKLRVFLWCHIKPILQVIILGTAMLVSSLHGAVLENTTKCSLTFKIIHPRWSQKPYHGTFLRSPRAYNFHHTQIICSQYLFNNQIQRFFSSI